MSERLQPALWGGVFIGVLSALPYVSTLNACCCLWVVSGGVLAAYLLQERNPLPILTSDAALTGLAAGALGAIIATLLGLGIGLVQGVDPTAALDQIPGGDLPPEMTELVETLRSLPVSFWYLGPLVISLIVFPIFGTLGSLLGVAVFKKNLPPPPPPGTIDMLPSATVDSPPSPLAPPPPPPPSE